jgi:hypothetical protein
VIPREVVQLCTYKRSIESSPQIRRASRRLEYSFPGRKRPSRARSLLGVEGRVVRTKMARPVAAQGRFTNNQSLTRSVNDLHQLSATFEDASGLVQSVPGKSHLETFGFQQQAGDIVVLRRAADEEVDFGHEALEHFGGFDRLAGFDRAQQARLAVFRLLGVFRFH